MSAPDYAQLVTSRISAAGPVSDERLNGIDFELAPAERDAATMAMRRARGLGRDVEQEPRVGDVVQWHSGVPTEALPDLLTITEITDERVYWVRAGEHWSTDRAYWRGERFRSGPRGRLELIREAA